MLADPLRLIEIIIAFVHRFFSDTVSFFFHIFFHVCHTLIVLSTCSVLQIVICEDSYVCCAEFFGDVCVYNGCSCKFTCEPRNRFQCSGVHIPCHYCTSCAFALDFISVLVYSPSGVDDQVIVCVDFICNCFFAFESLFQVFCADFFYFDNIRSCFGGVSCL